MIRVTTRTSTEEAEEIGARLLEGGVSPQIIQTSVYVAAEDEKHALQILDMDEEPPPELVPPPSPFHPCPQCGTPDPIWYGRRKATVWLTLLAILIAIMVLRLPGFGIASIACFIVFVIAIAKIPEYECRQCRHRWSKERELDD